MLQAVGSLHEENSPLQQILGNLPILRRVCRSSGHKHLMYVLVMREWFERIRPTWLDFVQKSYVALLARLVCIRDMSYNMQVRDMWQLLIQRGELVEMRREQAKRVDLGCYLSERRSARRSFIAGGWLTPRSPRPAQNHHTSKFLVPPSAQVLLAGD